MCSSQDHHLGRNADVVANRQTAPYIECAVAADPRVPADPYPEPAGLTRTPEPHVVAQVDAGVRTNLDSDRAAIPEMAKREAGHVSHDVVRQVEEEADDQQAGGEHPPLERRPYAGRLRIPAGQRPRAQPAEGSASGDRMWLRTGARVGLRVVRHRFCGSFSATSLLAE